MQIYESQRTLRLSVRGASSRPFSQPMPFRSFENPSYTGPDFRVARMAFCAHDPGDLVLHWQFSPPDPIARITVIVDVNNSIVIDRNCYVDYVVYVIVPSLSPTPTFTPSNH